MKKYVALGILCSVLMGADAIAARSGTPVTRGGSRAPVATTATTGGVSARAATPQTGMKKVARGAAPVANTGSKTGGVSARAATMQKAISNNTKVAEATTNIVVSEECKNKYYGCMDSFCMLDNTNGGRCLCSDKHAELENILAEIQKLDEQSYAMATTGVERINMGEGADEVNAMVDNITKSMTAKKEETKKKTKKLNLDAWNTAFDEEDVDIFNNMTVANTDLSDKTGNDLHSAVMGVCAKQIPECSSSINMLKMMYSQQIKADCGAYENSLKQQKNASAKKLQTAQQALREAALEQYQNANKYDLGQCTIRFKECMQTTAGCGEDFSKCASTVAMENAKAKAGTTPRNKNYTIKIEKKTISITASTYDTLLGKKVMCESVTKQCQKVKDKVWDSFLTTVAPELKSAELIAESNIRTNCMSNISECFQKACKDTMDPNDPEGSYDMCLSRPQTMRSVCKVQIEPCEQADSNILEYVYARLRSMRVDSCTKEVKQCLQREDACGENYANCIGLDTDTIIYQMCPADKLTACNTDPDTGEKITQQAKVIDNITQIIQGIILNIDNDALTSCQNALNTAMTRVCGGTEDCEGLAVDFSTLDSLGQVQACIWNTEDGKDKTCYTDPSQIDADKLYPFKLNVEGDGTITETRKEGKGFGVYATVTGIPDISNITYKESGETDEEGNSVTTSEFAIKDGVSMDDNIKEATQKVVDILNSALNRTEALIKQDTKVKWCVEGRAVQGLKRGSTGSGTDTNGRYPNLTDEARSIIVNTLLSRLSQYNENVQSRFESKKTAMSKKITEQIAKAEEAENKNVEERKKVMAQKVANQNAKTCLNYSQPDPRRNCPLADLNENGGQQECKNAAGKKVNKVAQRRVARRGVYELTDIRGVYDAAAGVCKLETVKYKCDKKKHVMLATNYCLKFDTGTVISTREIPMTNELETSNRIFRK